MQSVIAIIWMWITNYVPSWWTKGVSPQELLNKFMCACTDNICNAKCTCLHVNICNSNIRWLGPFRTILHKPTHHISFGYTKWHWLKCQRWITDNDLTARGTLIICCLCLLFFRNVYCKTSCLNVGNII